MKFSPVTLKIAQIKKINVTRSDISKKHFKFYFLGVITLGLMIGLLSWSGLTDAQGNVQVSGTVTSQSGAGIGDVTVYASTPGTNNDISGTTTTDLNGNYVLSVPTGTYDFHFIPPSATGMSTQVESNITVSSNQTINVQYPVVNYIFSGTITDNAGHDLVASVELTDSQGNSATIQASNGYFSISVEPGVYALSVDGKDTYVGGNNGFQFGIAQSNSNPSINMTSGDVTQNLQLNTAVMTTTVYNPQGYPDSGAILNAYALHGTTSLYPGDPGETISSVLDGNTTNLGTIVGATYGTALNPNTENGSICYENYPYTGNPVCLAAPLTVTGNMNVAVPQSPPPTNTFSGTVTDNEGHALNNVMVYLTDAYGNTVSASTNNSGVFSVSAEPGTYAVSVIGKDTYVGGNGGFMFSIAQSSSNPTINLNDGNITQNLQLDTATLNVTAYTSQGTPATNASAIYGDATSGTTSLYPGDPGETIKTSMGAGSGYTLNLGTVVGAVYAASSVTSTYAKSLCYENPPTYNFVCLNSPVTASGNMAVGIPQGSLTPSAPTNLTAPTPTDAAPSLSWNSVSGATSYNIYRDGTEIQTGVTGTSYTDTSTLTSGTTYSYYVTAVNSSGESTASNTISVLYDTTPPTITYAVTPIADSNGYNTGNVLVTFTCTSPTTGVTITSCTSPVTEPDEGIGQIVAGSAVDSAGNTSMINANASLLVSAISAGGTGSSPYGADANYTGGSTYSSSANVDTSNVLNPAPQSVYQNSRYGNTFSYTFSGLTPSAAYTLRLDFNELYFGTALSSTGGIGSRVFNVAVNGTPALSNFDIYAAAGGSNKAIAEQIPTTADSNGNVTITFTSDTDNALVSGLELFTGTLPGLAPIAPVTSSYIAAGSTSPIGSFSSDNDYSGGTTYSTNATIDTSGVSNPAPEAVYQNDRYGNNFTYTIPNLVPNTNYNVRLDFAEPYWGLDGRSGADSRLFNVTINGTQVLNDFDVYATAGGANKAVAENFTATSDSNGRITINFAAVTDNAMVSGIEVGEE